MSTSSFSTAALPIHDGLLEVHLLGTVDFDAALGLQEQQVYELSGQNNKNGILFLCEHPLLVSMGREASRSQLRLDDEEIQRKNLKVRWVSRGGGAMLHAPGQLAIYLQVPLQRLGIGITEFRTLFETSLVGVLRELKIPAKRSPDASGIWSRNGQIASLGAAVKSWISCHGMFLNVSIDPSLLDWLSHPCGGRLTTMQSQRLDPVRMPQVREATIRHLSYNFGYASAEVSTGHPLLRRTLQRAIIHA